MVRISSHASRAAKSRYGIAVTLSLSVGLAGVTGFWSVVSRVLSAYRISDGRQLVRVMEDHQGLHLRTAPKTDAFRNWKDSLRSFERLEAVSIGEAVMNSHTGPQALLAARVGAGFFELIGVAPIAGRALDISDEPATQSAALLSENLAESTFGSAALALGRTIRLDGRVVLIVGVLPPDFSDAIDPTGRIDVVLPLDYAREPIVQVMGRLRANVTLAAAQQELDLWAAQAPTGQATEGLQRWVVLSQIQIIQPELVRLFQMSVLGGLILLLVTSVNLAHLFAAQTEHLRKESATRWALGATPSMLLRWKWTQALWLVLFAGVGAVILANWALAAMAVVLPDHLQFLSELRVRGDALALALGSSFLVMCGLGLVAVLRMPWRVASDLRADGRFGRPSAMGGMLGSAYIASLVACCFVLVVAGYLVTGTVLNLGRVDMGFEPEGLHVATVKLPERKYGDAAQRASFVQSLSDRLPATPATKSLAVSSSAPPKVGVFVGTIVLGRTPRDRPLSTIGLASVVSGYFRTMRQPVIAGREFAPDEVRTGAMVVIVSETAARLLGPDPRAVLGERIRFGKETREVVGVVSDVRSPGYVDALNGLQVYWPLTRPRQTMTVLVRGDKTSAAALRTLIHSVDPDIVVEPAPMERHMEESLDDIRFLLALFAIMVTLAVTMAVFGIYAMISSVVIRQRRVIALRLALGASRGEIRRWVVWQAFSKALIGIALGAAASYPFCRLLSGQLFGIEPHSLTARAFGVALVLMATALATAPAAIRTSRIMPHEVLKDA